MIADKKVQEKTFNSLWLKKNMSKIFLFFILNKRIKMRCEKSKIKKKSGIRFLTFPQRNGWSLKKKYEAYKDKLRNNWNIELSNETLIIKIERKLFR